MRRLAAHDLLPGEGDDIELGPVQRHGEGGRGRVADREAATGGGDEVGRRHADAGGGAVPGEDEVAGEVDRLEIGQRAVGRHHHAGALQRQFLGGVGDPFLAEGFPGQHGNGARAEQRPHRHLDGAGVGGRHDRDTVRGRHLEHVPCQVDRPTQARLAGGGPVRASGQHVAEHSRRPARPLGAGPGREARIARPATGFDEGHGINPRGARHRAKAARHAGCGPPASSRAQLSIM